MWQALKNETREQHSLFGKEIRKWTGEYARGGGRIFCEKGCSACCNLAVNATFTEALCVADDLTAERVAKLRDHAGHLLERARRVSDLKSYLRMHRKEIGFCPFLDDDGACGIYGARPFSCRSLLATRESVYCGLDFGELSREEKMAFISSLDLSVAAFPMHYVAATQDLGQQREAEAARRMAARFGFSVYGSFAFLVFLELEYRLSSVMGNGYDETVGLLEREGLNNPFLITLDR